MPVLSHNAPSPVRAISDIQQRSPSDLKPWPTNPRTHPAKQLAKIVASIRKFGFTMPVLVDEAGFILSGHGRVEAAGQLKLPLIPVRVASGWTTADKRAYVIADNKLALLSSWDVSLLKSEMEILITDDFDIEVTGFSTAEIDLMFEEQGATADDLQPEDLAVEVVSRLGDLWRLGPHVLLCGDALADASYAALLGGEQAHMSITDPPYNVKINGHVGGLGKIKHKEFAMGSGEMDEGQFTGFLGTTCNWLHRHTVEGAISYVFMDWRHMTELSDAARPVFGAVKQLCVWVKDNAGMGSFYRSQHELAFVFKKGNAPHINNFELGQHGRYRTNVWEYPGASSKSGRELLALHPTVKPVAMIADAIRDCSPRKGLILDPFAGSGTVRLAAERTGRRARAIELDPHYVDVGVRRWQRATGKQALLVSTGQTWDEVRGLRQVQTLPKEVSDAV